VNILITGGAGYIGFSLVNELLSIDDVKKVVVYDNMISCSNQFFLHKFQHAEKLTFVSGDILDNKRLAEQLKGIDVVYHLAAKVTEPESDIDSHYFDQTNHWGTSILVDALEHIKPIKVIYISSIYVYGHHDDQITKDTSTTPKSFYGISKLRGEEQMKRLKDLTELYTFRVANVFGINPCIRLDLLINKFLFESHFNRKINIWGNGSQIRAFVEVRSLARILVKPILGEVETGNHNLVEINMSINDLYVELSKIYPDLQYFYVNRHIRMNDINVKVPDNLKHEDALEKFREDISAIKRSLL